MGKLPFGAFYPFVQAAGSQRRAFTIESVKFLSYPVGQTEIPNSSFRVMFIFPAYFLRSQIAIEFAR
jgi:hypothetical protein